MTGKQIILLLISLFVVWLAGGVYLAMRQSGGELFQVYTGGGVFIWLAIFVQVMSQIQISKMSPAEYAEYKNRPQPESLM